MRVKKRLHRGGALQITLIIITVFMQVILSYAIYIQTTAGYDRSITLINEQREIEICFHRYLLTTYENDMLLSDTINGDHGKLKYTVDDMGSYYLIRAYIRTDYYDYSITAEMVLSDGHFKSYSYS